MPELDTVIGWEAGFDALHTTPVFIKEAKDVERLVWNPLCTRNLSGYLVKNPPVQSSD